ncbi:hypothetical protein PMAYCL1PPCAC_31786, partial [Pristionchus mayeri]
GSSPMRNGSTTWSDEDGLNALHQVKRRIRRPVSANLRAERLAESDSSDLITKSRETNYANPLTKEGIEVINQQLSQPIRRRTIDYRLIAPPSRGANIVPVKIDRTSVHNPKLIRRANEGARTIILPNRSISGQDTRRLFASAAGNQSVASSSSPVPQSTNGAYLIRKANHDSRSFNHSSTASTSSTVPSSVRRVPTQPHSSSLEKEVKLEDIDPDKASSSSPKFIAVDVSEIDAEEKEVKLELEDPIEAPDAQPLRYMADAVHGRKGNGTSDGPRLTWKNDVRPGRQKKIQEQLRQKTVAYWEETAQDTLKLCNEASKKTVAADDWQSHVDLEMIQAMAEFLSPALMRLDQIEQPEFSSVANDMSCQRVVENTSAKLMDSVVRQEAEKYRNEFVPIVKFARAFATFAVRFASLSQDQINPVELVQYSNVQAMAEDERAYDDFYESMEIPPMPSKESTPERSHMDIHLKRVEQEMRRFEEEEVEHKRSDQIATGAQKRKRLHAEVAGPGWSEERVEVHENDSSKLYRRKINPKYTRPPKPVPSVNQSTCPYCKEEFISENLRIEHVRRIHIDEWKAYAPFECIYKPHCDFRAVKADHMEEHMNTFHDEEWKNWIAVRRMDIGDETTGIACPFCDLKMYNVLMLHDHLQGKHRKALAAAYARNLPFFGCGSCMFSSFWAHEVYKHWKEKNYCTGRLVLRKLTHVLPIEQRPTVSGHDRLRGQIHSQQTYSIQDERPRTRVLVTQNDAVIRPAEKRPGVVIVRRPSIPQPLPPVVSTSQTDVIPPTPSDGLIKSEEYEDEQSASPLMFAAGPLIDEDQIKKEDDLD